MGEGLNYYLGTLMPRIKHYAKSVSTGNLAIHLHDQHNIATGGPSFSSSSSGRPGWSHSRSKHKFNLQRNSAINFFPFNSDSQNRKPSKNGSVLILDSEDHSTSSNFASIDSSGNYIKSCLVT